MIQGLPWTWKLHALTKLWEHTTSSGGLSAGVTGTQAMPSFCCECWAFKLAFKLMLAEGAPFPTELSSEPSPPDHQRLQRHFRCPFEDFSSEVLCSQSHLPQEGPGTLLFGSCLLSQATRALDLL